MGKYIGPVCRLCRREGVKLLLKGDRCLTGKCALSRKKKAPGMSKGKKGKLSYYGMQLREKQKVKRFYALSESHFKKYYLRATSTEGNTGNILFQLLERRMDNVVYRLGLAVSRRQARFLISHGHFTLNDRKVNISSIIVRKGDIIKVGEKGKNFVVFQDNVKKEVSVPTWLEKTDDFSGKVMELPGRENVNDIPIKEQMIIELYSK
ncbi:MAG TPA: 30S ribosomal protein S4 [Spirochaetia bacterium]|nr:MAG: 30S ribosomal protein S4 [Spirochaetes bacterium GWB1_36_13]HCL55823.1 30S ribosomal protein S4 [Spirochaetia bacterium]